MRHSKNFLVIPIILISLGLTACVTFKDDKTAQLAAREVADMVNHERSLVGLPPFELDERISEAAWYHSHYLSTTNFGHLSHLEEFPSSAYYRGKSPGDRTAAAGGSFIASEVISSGPHDSFYHTQILLTVPFHRIPFFDNFKAIGVGLVRGLDGYNILTINFNDAYIVPKNQERFIVWPYPDQTSVAKSIIMIESLIPVPQNYAYQEIAYPITIQLNSHEDFTTTNCEIKSIGTEPPDLYSDKEIYLNYIERFSGDPYKNKTKHYENLNYSICAPIRPYRANTTYEVTITGVMQGNNPFKKIWQFTTGP